MAGLFNAGLVEKFRAEVNADIAFVIQRTKNGNVVVYQGNRGADGALNPHEPMIVYWLDIDPAYLEKAKAAGKNDPFNKNDLNMFEKQFAYGLSAAPIAGSPGKYKITLVAVPHMDVTLELVDGKVVAKCVINGKQCILQNICVDSTDRWVGPPKVNFVELHGREVETGAWQVEKITP